MQLIYAIRNLIKELENEIINLPAQQKNRQQELNSAITSLSNYEVTLDSTKESLNKRLEVFSIDSRDIPNIDKNSNTQIGLYEDLIKDVQNLNRQINETRDFNLKNANVLAREQIYGKNSFVEITTDLGNKNQTLYRRLADNKEYLLDSLGQKVPRYVYRSINKQDDINIGKNPKKQGAIEARNPQSNTNPLGHSMGATTNSPWISVTKIQEEIYNPKGVSFDNYGKVKIDLLGVDPKDIIDLTTKKALTEKGFPYPPTDELTEAMQTTRDVIRTQEILVKKRILGDLIERLPKNN